MKEKRNTIKIKKKVDYNEILSAPYSSSESNYYTMSFFTGVRGLDIGAKKAGFQTIFHSDIMKAAGDVFRLNSGNKKKHLRSEGVFPVGKESGDIHNLNFANISRYIYQKLKIRIKKGEIAVVHGGPPCQDISKANPLRRVTSKKNRLIFELLRIIRECKPMVGLIEQVPDLLSVKYQRLWTEIKVYLDSMTDYIWDYEEMNAVDYGARQSRKRLIIMIVRKDLGVSVSFPEPTQKNIETVYVKRLLPHINFFSPGQFGDNIHPADSNVFCTMTATGCEKVYEMLGKGRSLSIPERLILTELEGLITDGIPITWLKKLTGNMVQVSLAEALFRHIRCNIIGASEKLKQNRRAA